MPENLYPNNLRHDYISPGAFIWYTDPRPESQRDCPALIIKARQDPDKFFDIVFLDTMEKCLSTNRIAPLDGNTQRMLESRETNILQRSFMRAAPREKAVSYVKLQAEENLQEADNASKAEAYIKAASSFGLLDEYDYLA